MTTPTIPDWIRNFRTDSYTNIYQLCPDETRLYGTESLYDDWSGELLLLAKDFYPSSYIEERIATDEKEPYSHNQSAPTNRYLVELAEDIPCTKLYGSAFAGLLRKDGNKSGSLQCNKAIKNYICDVLLWVVEQMPNLRAIACLGVDAWDCATEAIGNGKVLRTEYRDPVHPLELDGLQLFALQHPSRWTGGKSAIYKDWADMRRYLCGNDAPAIAA